MDRQKTRAVDSRIQAEDKEKWAKETGYKIIDFYRHVRSQINLYRFEEGKIAETWQLMDVAGFMRQIGALTT